MYSDAFLTLAVGTAAATLSVAPYLIRYHRREKRAKSLLKTTAGTALNLATVMHPCIDALKCIGCGSCARACPEGDVLGVIEGRSTLIHGARCVGHALCAEACPVGAIRMVMGQPGSSAEVPQLDSDLQTTVRGLYIVGELGGMGLIRNAVTQGIRAVERIASLKEKTAPPSSCLDLLIAGAGPAGLAAALTAQKHGLKYLVVEQDDIGGTILQYPRRKIVMTSPVELPLYGKLRFRETSKESLLEVWNQILKEFSPVIQTCEKLLQIVRNQDGFDVRTSRGRYQARYVILALGRRGTPRKLGVPGEQLSKVSYRLIEAESYQDCRILVVGGGDSAVEAAMALAVQRNNRVTISYRKAEFSRIKERNASRLSEMVRGKRLEVLFESNVREIADENVVIEAQGSLRTIGNNYVFVFAGGELPYDLLRAAGVHFCSQDLAPATGS